MVVLLYNVVMLYGYINPIICGGTTRHKGTHTPELLKVANVAPAAFWRVKMWLQKQRDSRHKI